MAEADEPGHAKHEVERERRDGEDAGAGEEADEVILPGQAREDGGRDQQRDGDKGQPVEPPFARARAGLGASERGWAGLGRRHAHAAFPGGGNRPCGRTTSTAAIST